MRSGTLRKYNGIDVEGLLLSIPLLLFEYYVLAVPVLGGRISFFMLLLLLVLGAFINRYTGAIALLVLSYLAYTMNVRSLLFASVWLIGIAFSKRTTFLDKLLSYMFVLLFNAILVSSSEGYVYLFISMIPVLLYLSMSLERHSLARLSLSLFFASTIIALSKITGSILSLNLFVAVIVVSIYLAYKTVNATMEA